MLLSLLDLPAAPTTLTKKQAPAMNEAVRADMPQKGKRVRLKEGTFPHVKIREWVVDQYLPNGKIILKLPDKNYTLDVMPGDIEL